MANSGEAATNTGKLPQFGVCKPFEQRAIVLRAGGSTAKEVTNQINAEFDLAYTTRTIEEWFYADGRLIQAYLEYNGELADQAVAAAKNKIKKSSELAADTLTELMGDTHEGSVRVRAALGILSKYVPDRQVILDGGKVDELPEEIGGQMDEAIDGDSIEPNEEPGDDQPPASPEAS